MRPLSRVATAILSFLTLTGTADPPRYPPDSVVLVVAPWCAPCHAELARLDGIAAAAAPRTVRVFLAEQGPRAEAMVRGVVPGRRWQPPGEAWHRARADLMARTPGLPFSIVTDGAGAICTQTGAGLDPQRVRALVARCR